MSLELFLYVIFFIITAYLITTMNIEKLFRKGRILESRIFLVLISMSISYLATNFVLRFLEVSKII